MRIAWYTSFSLSYTRCAVRNGIIFTRCAIKFDFVMVNEVEYRKYVNDKVNN